jgi:protein-glutamine gamma-glutamyltransferase
MKPKILWLYWVQIILISIFVREELTIPTLLTVFIVFLLNLKNETPHPWVPKILGALIFIFAYLKNGKIINPEVGFNILMAVTVLKMLEMKNLRDWRMLTLGMFINWATGSLFDKTIGYFFFAILGTIISVAALSSMLDEKLKLNLKDIFRWFLKAFPLAIVLFFVLPRFQSGLWTPPVPKPQGEIGFSEDARPGDVEEVKPTGEIAFHAIVSPIPKRENLYWRGITFSGQDGWNWYPSPADNDFNDFRDSGNIPNPSWYKQEIIHKKIPQRAFGLDWPKWWEKNNLQAPSQANGTFKFTVFKNQRRYKVVSAETNEQLEKPLNRSQLMVIAKKTLPEELINIKPTSLEEAQKILPEYFSKNNFLYSIAAGKIGSISEFIVIKKGWCVHYASFTAQVLRFWGFPTRLVSGYLGGEYSAEGNYFTVKEDDAHVWVESWDGTSWRRIDPTIWIIPERMSLSGTAFYEKQILGSARSSLLPNWVRDYQAYVDELNFKFLLWSEQVDQEKQKEWAKIFDMNLQSFYLSGIWILSISMILYWGIAFINFKKSHPIISLQRKIWMKLVKKYPDKINQSMGPSEARSALVDHPEVLEWLNIWETENYARDPRIEELRKLADKI